MYVLVWTTEYPVTLEVSIQVDPASTLNSSFSEDSIDSMACSVTDAIVTTLSKHARITLPHSKERHPCRQAKLLVSRGHAFFTNI